MRTSYCLLVLAICCLCMVPIAAAQSYLSGSDWLITPSGQSVELVENQDGDGLTLTNGLITRTFRLAPNAATVGFDNLITDASMLRSVRPEARIQLDGVWYDIGGLVGQPNHAYLTDAWIDAMQASPDAFQYTGYSTGEIEAHLEWKQRRYAANTTWPPPGKRLTLQFEPPASVADRYQGLSVAVHYNMYQDIPLLSKWITVHNETEQTVELDAFVGEILAVVEAESTVEPKDRWRLPDMHVESDYSFHGMDPSSSNRTTYWLSDTLYTTQVSYLLQTPALLESKPPLGPDLLIEPGESFTSFRTYELLFDSDDRERRGLAMRRMYRTIAPWITENPIFMHVRQSDSESVRRAIDQSAEVGFEMVILTFGSGFNMEDLDPDYLARIKSDVEYARSKGIELGGYSLLASRRISDEHDVINPETGKTGGAIFNNSPCLRSHWGENYFQTIQTFIEETGLDLLEHDGNYPGDICASTSHPYHRGMNDSQWLQWERITQFYNWSLANGVYLNVPDYYFLNGSTKVAMGYRETNWSLPRAQQIIHGRQNIYDGTWTKTPSMGWMFVPLVEYHGGGEAATLEPLSEHLEDYEAHLANLFGAGVMAAYRGPRLYDTDETKAVVQKWVDFYKKYRPILDSDIIHVRRADGQDLDAILHVNPQLPHKGLAMVYNPTEQAIDKVLNLPLYYTGLTDTAQIREQEGASQSYSLDRAYHVALPVSVPARGVTWFVIE